MNIFFKTKSQMSSTVEYLFKDVYVIKPNMEKDTLQIQLLKCFTPVMGPFLITADLAADVMLLD